MLAGTPEKYFQRTNCIPLLENIISEMKDRFSTYVMSFFNLNVFFLRTSNKEIDLSSIREAAKKYKGFLNVQVSFVVFKYELWMTKWKRKAVETKGKYIFRSL